MIQFIRVTLWLTVTLLALSRSAGFSNTLLVWPDAPNGRLYRIDVQEGRLETEIQPTIWQVLGEVQMKNVAADAFPPAMRVTCLPVGTSRFRYLLVDCTQQVYRFDMQTRTLERLDNTFFRGYNCYSTKFLRRDTLYSVGGYGFWHTNNILSYYKAINQEWESVNPTANAPHSIYQGFNGYLPEQDRFFSALSLYQNDSENKGAFTWSDSVYAYSFSKKTWERLGQLTPEVHQQIPDDFIEKATWFQVGQYFLLKYYKSPQTFFLIVDPVRNEARIWRDTRKVLANLSDTYNNNIPGSYVWHSVLYFRRYATGVTGKTIEVIRLPIAELWRNSTVIGTFYEPAKTDNRGWFYAVSIILFIGGAGAVFWFRKSGKSKAVPTLVDLPYPGSLNEREKELFDALLKADTPEGLTGDEVYEVLAIDNNTKSIENQRKIRSEVIKSINQKLKTEWGIDEAVKRIPTALDQRIFTFILKPQVLNQMRKNQPERRIE